jgi:hypothetical protein
MVPSIGAADYLTVDPQRNSESLLPSWWIMLLRVSCWNLMNIDFLSDIVNFGKVVLYYINLLNYYIMQKAPCPTTAQQGPALSLTGENGFFVMVCEFIWRTLKANVTRTMRGWQQLSLKSGTRKPAVRYTCIWDNEAKYRQNRTCRTTKRNVKDWWWAREKPSRSPFADGGCRNSTQGFN